MSHWTSFACHLNINALFRENTNYSSSPFLSLPCPLHPSLSSPHLISPPAPNCTCRSEGSGKRKNTDWGDDEDDPEDPEDGPDGDGDDEEEDYEGDPSGIILAWESLLYVNVKCFQALCYAVMCCAV